MITTTILRVGQSYRVKFGGQSLSAGSFTEAYFTAEELEELHVAVERARANIQERRGESVDVESASRYLHAIRNNFEEWFPYQTEGRAENRLPV